MPVSKASLAAEGKRQSFKASTSIAAYKWSTVIRRELDSCVAAPTENPTHMPFEALSKHQASSCTRFQKMSLHAILNVQMYLDHTTPFAMLLYLGSNWLPKGHRQ